MLAKCVFSVCLGTNKTASETITTITATTRTTTDSSGNLSRQIRINDVQIYNVALV